MAAFDPLAFDSVAFDTGGTTPPVSPPSNRVNLGPCACCRNRYYYPYGYYYYYYGMDFPIDERRRVPCCNGLVLPEVMYITIAPRADSVNGVNPPLLGSDTPLTNSIHPVNTTVPFTFDPTDGYWHGEIVYTGDIHICSSPFASPLLNYVLRFTVFGRLQIRMKVLEGGCVFVQTRWLSATEDDYTVTYDDAEAPGGSTVLCKDQIGSGHLHTGGTMTYICTDRVEGWYSEQYVLPYDPETSSPTMTCESPIVIGGLDDDGYPKLAGIVFGFDTVGLVLSDCYETTGNIFDALSNVGIVITE